MLLVTHRFISIISPIFGLKCNTAVKSKAKERVLLSNRQKTSLFSARTERDQKNVP